MTRRVIPRGGAALSVAAALVLVGCTSPEPATEQAASPVPSEVPPIASSRVPSDLTAAVSDPVEDSYYPDRGEPTVDTLHYGLDLTWAETTHTLTGTAAITLRAPAATDRLQLDLSSVLAVSSVTADGVPVPFAQEPEDLLVIEHPLAADAQTTLVVSYAGTPAPAPAPTTRTDVSGLGLQIDAASQLWTMQEPYGAFTWYPVNDQPSDKAYYDFTITAPAGMVGVANGTMTSRTDSDAKTVTSFHLDEPAASYLTTLAVGRYTLTKETSASGVPLTYWTPTDRPDLLSRLKVLPRALAWSEQKLGAYPFDSLGLLVVDSESAMETQTLITLGNTDYATSPGVIAHEVIHQWYGDLVTPRDWSDVWMNEGMTMLMQLAFENPTPAAFNRVLRQQATADPLLRQEAGPPGAYSPGAFGSGNIYYSPAVMWNELRLRIGDRKFWTLVKRWPQEHRGGNADRAELFTWWEQQTGLELTAFFTAWIEGYGAPKP